MFHFNFFLNFCFELVFVEPEKSRTSKRGRPKKSFDDSGIESKRKKTQKLVAQTSTSELIQATCKSLRTDGKKPAAKLIGQIAESSPESVTEILEALNIDPAKKKQQVPYLPEDAVSLIIDLNLTKAQYLGLRMGSIKRGHDLYPSYEKILAAKKRVYPPGLTVTERKCEVSLQNLLDHTTKRLFEHLKTTSIALDATEESDLRLDCKYGFDGSSGYSEYKQVFTEDGSSDSSLFVTSFVPLQLVNQGTDQVVWTNPRPSSVRLCRPIRIQWKRETDAISREEREYIERQITNLQPFVHENFTVSFSLRLTMIDGKVCNC